MPPHPNIPSDSPHTLTTQLSNTSYLINNCNDNLINQYNKLLLLCF